MQIKRFITLTALAVVFTNSIFSQVGIGTITPVSSAELDVTSTTKGFLVPRMTRAQRITIASPVAGLQVWCTDCGNSGEMQVYNGTTWTNMCSGTASGSVPSSPTALVTKIGSTQVSVAFTAPLSDGGSTITSYTVTSSPGGLTATGTTSPLVVAGLTNGIAYSFTVVATNTFGNSAASIASSAVTPNCGAYTTSGTYLVFACYNLGVTSTVDPMITGNQTSSLYGDYYQWGRQADGHQLSNSPTTTTQATASTAVDSKFIITSANWTTLVSNTLWGDGTAVINPAKASNDPCPTGFKVPSKLQWWSIFSDNVANNLVDNTGYTPATATANAWTWTGNGFTVGTGLFLPAAGFRATTGSFTYLNGVSEPIGRYWSSTFTTSSTTAYSMNFSTTAVVNGSFPNRSNGNSIRCVKE